MTSNSRGILLAGAFLLVASAAGISSIRGTGWIIPMAILLSGILGILVFSFLTMSKENSRGSTPFGTVKTSGSKNIEASAEDLPDPQDSGFELPIM